MTALRSRMIDDMVAAGLMPATQAAYVRAVRGLAAYYRRSPDLLSEAEVRSYLLYLRDERGLAHGTYGVLHGAIQFFFWRTLDREWSLFSKKEFARPRGSGSPPCCRTRRLEPSLAA